MSRLPHFDFFNSLSYRAAHDSSQRVMAFFKLNSTYPKRLVSGNLRWMATFASTETTPLTQRKAKLYISSLMKYSLNSRHLQTQHIRLALRTFDLLLLLVLLYLNKYKIWNVPTVDDYEPANATLLSDVTRDAWKNFVFQSWKMFKRALLIIVTVVKF